jgi:hypothetical protein
MLFLYFIYFVFIFACLVFVAVESTASIWNKIGWIDRAYVNFSRTTGANLCYESRNVNFCSSELQLSFSVLTEKCPGHLESKIIMDLVKNMPYFGYK